MRDRGVAGGQGGGAMRIARADVTVDIGADERTYPLAVRVSPGGGLGRQVSVDEIAVGDALGGVRLQERETFQPEGRDIRHREIGAVLFEQVQAQHRVVEVVVARCAVDVAERGFRPGPMQSEVVGHGIAGGDVIAQGVGGGGFQIGADAVGCPDETVLQRLAERAADATAQPAAVDAIEQFRMPQGDRAFRGGGGVAGARRTDIGPFVVGPAG
ncbi:hypothetical protein LTV02_32815 [Nocardia yamanashiensis]|nr:hypothetical protein [Nocardia yamanashiensis]UGT40725.1 hypothetical protein LTV02_32815 [Nocardia yamanashiensis]